MRESRDCQTVKRHSGIVNRLLRRVATTRKLTTRRITKDIAQDALNRIEVDTFGLDEMDRKFLLTIIVRSLMAASGTGYNFSFYS